MEIAASSVQAHQRIRNHIHESPLIPARSTDKLTDATVPFKAENFQITGSFKLRGAVSKMSATATSCAERVGARLITASSGNHGIGAAFAARCLEKDLTVVLPESVVPSELEKIKALGVEIILHGAETGLAEQYARQLAATGQYTYISPYNDADVIAGQGTIGLEILEQCESVDNVFISMGGGGRTSGIGSVLKAFSPETKVWGVAAAHSMALAALMDARRVVETEHLATLADAVAAGTEMDTITLSLAMSTIDEAADCDEDSIVDALRTLALVGNMIVEGAAALALADYNKVADRVSGQTSVILLCGANQNQDLILGAICSKN
ncbi:hypothetical protein KCU62_g9034, partial [Aureobasidium sp. EXF-3399]